MAPIAMAPDAMAPDAMAPDAMAPEEAGGLEKKKRSVPRIRSVPLLFGNVSILTDPASQLQVQ
jgi:hypothetical protein